MTDSNAGNIEDRGATLEAAARRGISERLSVLIPAAVAALLLAPFIRRAFGVDDPLFIWMAEQILKHPLDPYGFTVNWSFSQQPMSVVMQNPPLNSYFIAGVIRSVGLSEVRLHLAFLLPAMAAALGTYLLARRFCTRPLAATLAAVLTPAFAVSGSTVMCDMMMLALWVWAVYLWVKGTEEDRVWMIVLASLLIALSALTKYYGVALIPLLLAWTLLSRHRPARLLWLLVPISLLIAYNLWTKTLYGRPLMLDAFGLSGQYREALGTRLFPKTMVGLSFAGGCLASVIFLAPVLWSRRWLAAWIVLAAGLTLLCRYTEAVTSLPIEMADQHRWLIALHLGVFAAAGASIFVLALKDLSARRDADSALFFLWLAGTLIFVGLLNWTVNGRVILPMAPALGIVAVRAIERRGKPISSLALAVPLILSALVALSVAHADRQFADSQRAVAHALHRDFETDGTMRFQGHWGFQFYMERLGAKPLELRRTRFRPGDVVVIPENNTCVDIPPQGLTMHRGEFPGSRWLSTMSFQRKTGFHSDAWGPIPYGLGLTSPEIYYIIPMDDYNLSLLAPPE